MSKKTTSESHKGDLPEIEPCTETLGGGAAIRHTAKGTLLRGDVDCFILENGQRVVGDCFCPCGDKMLDAWNDAFERVASTNLVSVAVGDAVVRTVELGRLIEELERTCDCDDADDPKLDGTWWLLGVLGERAGRGLLSADEPVPA